MTRSILGNVTLPLAIVASIALASCQPPSAEWTEAEARNQLTLDTVPSRLDLHFAAQTDRPDPSDVKRLYDLVAVGAIGPGDRVTVTAAGGPPRLAEARAATIAALLLKRGIVTSNVRLGAAPPNLAVVSVERTLVTLPPCPNWSKPSGTDFTNSASSNFGCGTTVNLGRMVAYPADLIGGQQQGLPAGTPAVAAVNRYLTDKVELPAASTVGPIAAPQNAAPGASGGSP